MPLNAKLYFARRLNLSQGCTIFIAEDTGFVSSATSGRNKTARDETIFPFSRRHRETGLGY